MPAAHKKKLLTSILALPEPVRVEFIQALLHTLEPGVTEPGELREDELDEELTRRAKQLRADPTAGVPWSKVRKMR